MYEQEGRMMTCSLVRLHYHELFQEEAGGTWRLHRLIVIKLRWQLGELCRYLYVRFIIVCEFSIIWVSEFCTDFRRKQIYFQTDALSSSLYVLSKFDFCFRKILLVVLKTQGSDTHLNHGLKISTYFAPRQGQYCLEGWSVVITLLIGQQLQSNQTARRVGWEWVRVTLQQNGSDR